MVDACYDYDLEFQALHVVHGRQHDTIYITVVAILKVFVGHTADVQGGLEIPQSVSSRIGDGYILIADTALVAFLNELPHSSSVPRISLTFLFNGIFKSFTAFMAYKAVTAGPLSSEAPLP